MEIFLGQSVAFWANKYSGVNDPAALSSWNKEEDALKMVPSYSHDNHIKAVIRIALCYVLNLSFIKGLFIDVERA